MRLFESRQQQAIFRPTTGPGGPRGRRKGMTLMCYRNLLLGAVLGVGVVAFASKAQATSFADIQYWIGSGNNRAGLEIDWNDGKANHALSWGYRWNGGATGEQMFDAIVATDPRLYAEISGPTQFGTTVFGLGYDHNGDQVFPLSPTLGFSPQHLAVTNFAGVNDNRSAVDAGDRWQEGWLSAGYWNYWVSTDTRVSADVTDWSFSDDGMTTRAGQRRLGRPEFLRWLRRLHAGQRNRRLAGARADRTGRPVYRRRGARVASSPANPRITPAPGGRDGNRRRTLRRCRLYLRSQRLCDGSCRLDRVSPPIRRRRIITATRTPSLGDRR